MRGYLLDTNVALLAGQAPERLPRPVRRALETGPGFISVISYWEVMIKTMKGNLDVGDARRWWADSVADMVLTPVMFRPEHVAAIQRLEPHHSDPFDRAIIATAIAEELVLLTTDKGLNAYAGHGLKILR